MGRFVDELLPKAIDVKGFRLIGAIDLSGKERIISKPCITAVTRPHPRQEGTDMNDIETQLSKIAAWQYLNVATFIGVCAVLVILLF